MFSHIDVDAFFASSLQRRQPKLKGKPILALGMGGGCVIAASYEAKAYGVKTGMPLKEAKRLVPNAIAIPSDFDEALCASREIEAIIQNHSPVIERASIDEWYIDMNAIPKGELASTDVWAEKMQKEILQKTALTVSIGVAPTKLLSKMASEYRKPAGITIINDMHNSHFSLLTSHFLQDRPAAAIPGVGRRHSLHAEAHKWNTAWDFAHANSETVQRLMGKPGLELQQELLGNSLWKVNTDTSPPKSISRCRSFRNTNNREVIFSYLLDHLTYTMLKMRRKNLMCSMVSVWIRSNDYKGDGKTAKLPQPMDTEDQLLPYIRSCFEKLYAHQPYCTQIGLALNVLRPKAPKQFSLFEPPETLIKSVHVQDAMDTIHTRYGRDAVLRAAAIHTKGGRMKKIHVINE